MADQTYRITRSKGGSHVVVTTASPQLALDQFRRDVRDSGDYLLFRADSRGIPLELLEMGLDGKPYERELTSRDLQFLSYLGPERVEGLMNDWNKKIALEDIFETKRGIYQLDKKNRFIY